MTAPPARLSPRSGPELSFVPADRHGAVYPAVAAAVAGVLAIALLLRSVTTGISFASFVMLLVALVLLGVGGVAAYWAWACATLRYEFRAGVLTIRWGLVRHEIPVASFERIVRGRATGAVRVEGLDWPGCHIGRATLPRLGIVRFVSLHRTPAELLYLVGSAGAYAISVANPQAFIRAVQSQMEVRSTLDAPQVVVPPVLRLLGWRDRPLQAALALALALALVATGLVFSRYAGFPDEIVVNFPERARVASRTTVLWIPGLAWLLILVNGALGLRLSPDRRQAAMTLLGGLAFIEAILVLAAVTAV